MLALMYALVIVIVFWVVLNVKVHPTVYVMVNHLRRIYVVWMSLRMIMLYVSLAVITILTVLLYVPVYMMRMC